MISIRLKPLHYLGYAVWATILVTQLAIWMAGMGIWFQRMQQVCLQTAEVCQQQLRLPPVEVQVLLSTGWSLQAYAWFNLVTRTLVLLVSAGVGILIFVRKRNDLMSWIVSLALIIGIETSVPDALVAAQPAWWLPTRILTFIGTVAFGLFFYLFPDGQFTPRWTRWMALAWSAAFIGITFFPETQLSLNKWGLWAFPAAVLLFVSFILAQVARYRKVSNPVQRQQTRWVVFALILGILLMLASLVSVVVFRNPTRLMDRRWIFTSIGFLALPVLLPISIGVAILRYRLWDLDLIIRRTLVYSALTATLLALYFAGVVALQELFQLLTGQHQSSIATVLSTLAIAALFNPLRKRIQNTIDHRFYRRRYNAEQTLQSFANTLRDEVDIEQLSSHLVAVVQETMQPESISLWLRESK